MVDESVSVCGREAEEERMPIANPAKVGAMFFMW